MEGGGGDNQAIKGANVVPKSASSIIATAEKDELLGDSVREMVAEASKFGSNADSIGAEESDLCTFGTFTYAILCCTILCHVIE